MTTDFGVSMPKSLAIEIEGPLEYGDSRSERIRTLVEIGLAAERAFDELGIEYEDDAEQRLAVREAILEASE